jgi:hypothetical protein
MIKCSIGVRRGFRESEKKERKKEEFLTSFTCTFVQATSLHPIMLGRV